MTSCVLNLGLKRVCVCTCVLCVLCVYVLLWYMDLCVCVRVCSCVCRIMQAIWVILTIAGCTTDSPYLSTFLWKMEFLKCWERYKCDAPL